MQHWTRTRWAAALAALALGAGSLFGSVGIAEAIDTGGTVETVEDTTDDTVQTVEDTTDETVETTEDTVDDTVQTVEDTTDETVETVEDTVDDTVDDTVQTIDDTVDDVERTIDDTVDDVEQTVDDTVKTVEETVDAVDVPEIPGVGTAPGDSGASHRTPAAERAPSSSAPAPSASTRNDPSAAQRAAASPVRSTEEVVRLLEEARASEAGIAGVLTPFPIGGLAEFRLDDDGPETDVRAAPEAPVVAVLDGLVTDASEAPDGTWRFTIRGADDAEYTYSGVAISGQGPESGSFVERGEIVGRAPAGDSWSTVTFSRTASDGGPTTLEFLEEGLDGAEAEARLYVAALRLARFFGPMGSGIGDAVLATSATDVIPEPVALAAVVALAGSTMGLALVAPGRRRTHGALIRSGVSA